MLFPGFATLLRGSFFSSIGRAALRARALRFLRFQNMLNELSLKKTPLVAALGAALAVSIAAPVWAADPEKPADPTLIDADVSVWEAEKDAPSYEVSGKDGKAIYISDKRSVTAKGTGTVTSSMTVSGKGSFTNQSRSDLTFGDDSTLTINLTGSNTGEEDAKTGSFVNRGKVTLRKGGHAIKGDAIVQEDPDKKLALPTITMGDVVVTGDGATLTNANQGYVVKVKESAKEEGEEPTYKDDTRTLVSFDQLTLEKGGRFVNAEGARETGESLYVADSASSAEINGTSEWDTVTINLDAPAEDDTEDKPEGEKAAGDPAITVAKGARFSVTEGLTIRGNAGETEKSVFGGIVQVVEPAEESTESLVTIDGTLAFAHEGKLKLEPVKGVDISGVAIDLNRAFTDEELKDGSADEMSSMLVISGFNGKATEIPPETEDGEEGDKGDAATRAAGDEGTDADKPTHTWSAARLGAIAVDGLSTVNVSTANVSTAKPEGIETLDESKSDLFSTGECVALRTGHFTFTETWAKGKAVEWEKKEESASGKADGDAGEGGDEKTVLEKVDDKLKEHVVELTQEISDAQLRVDGVFGVLKGETRTVTFDFDENGGFLESTDGYESVANSTSENEYQQSKQKIFVNGSRLQASGLRMDGGSLTMTNSDVTFGALAAINGEVEFTVKAGENGHFLGLGWLPTEEELKNVPAKDRKGKATVFVGQTVVLDKDGSLVIGSTAAGNGKAADGEGEGDKEKNNASLTLGANSFLVVDTASFAQGALFASKLEKGSLTIEGCPTIDARNLTWGTYQLFENLDTAEGANNELEVKFDSTAPVQSHWLVNLSEAERDRVTAGYDPAKGWIKVGIEGADGAPDSSVEALRLSVDAANVANNVFVKGEHNTAYGDVAFITRAMGLVGTQIAGPTESASGASLLSTTDADGRVYFDANDFAKTMNLATSFAAATAVKALTVDFNSHTVDQIEHHAATIPHEMRGWWVQPIASKMKTDDLAAGSLTAGYSLDTVGIMGGYDFTVPNGDIWGIAASYQSGDADGEGDAQSMATDVTNYGFHLWAARHYGDLKVMGTLSYMVTDGDANMTIDRMGRLSSTDISSKAFAFGVNGALTKKFGAVTLVPHAGARAMMIDVDDITATYQGAEAFRFKDDTSWVFEVPVGATFKTAFEYQRWNVQPYLDLTVRGRFGDTDGSYTVTGASQGGSDTIDYDVTGSFVGDVKLGYMSTFKDLNLGMSYGFSAGDAGRQNHTLEATMRIDL